jgi:adenylate kinase family enzyme
MSVELTDFDLSRVVVVGTSGSGKTTFAAQLAAARDVPHHELDAFFRRAGWVSRSSEEMLELLSPHLAKKSWVADGNHGSPSD